MVGVAPRLHGRTLPETRAQAPARSSAAAWRFARPAPCVATKARASGGRHSGSPVSTTTDAGYRELALPRVAVGIAQDDDEWPNALERRQRLSLPHADRLRPQKLAQPTARRAGGDRRLGPELDDDGAPHGRGSPSTHSARRAASTPTPAGAARDARPRRRAHPPGRLPAALLRSRPEPTASGRGAGCALYGVGPELADRRRARRPRPPARARPPPPDAESRAAISSRR